MMQLSFWAKRHKWQARMLLVLIHGLLILLAFILGDGLQSMALFIPVTVVYTLLFAFLLACCLYPSKGEQYSKTYKSRKTCEAVVAITAFLLVASFYNYRGVANSPLPISTGTLAASVERPVVKPPVKALAKAKTLVQKLKATAALKYLKWKMHMKKAAPAEKVIEIILLLLLALVLFLLVLGLSCNLACAGSDAAALLVGIFGTGLIIFLVVKAIKSINRKFNTPPAPKVEKPSVTKAF